MMVVVHTTDDLVAFLRNRLNEDEQVARAANVKQDDPEWYTNHIALAFPRAYRVRSRRDNRPIATVTDVSGDEEADATGILDGQAAAAHIARHDPARVLREIESRRRLIDEHYPVDPCDVHDADMRGTACETLRLLASPHTDHEDYRAEWHPLR
jgi:hypothetical protein